MSHLALIVEDDRGLQMIYDRILSGMDFEVIIAGDGETALELLQEERPQIVFLDIQLPLLSGEAILEYIFEAPHLQDLFVVIVSSNKKYEVYLQHTSNAEFILKPIRPAQIRELASRCQL